MPKALSEQDFTSRVNERYNGRVTVTSKFVNTRTPVTFSCACGYTGVVTAVRLIKPSLGNYGCPSCALRARSELRTIPLEEIVSRIKSSTNYVLLGRATEERPVAYRCSVCERRYCKPVRKIRRAPYTNGCCEYGATAGNASRGGEKQTKLIQLNGKTRKVRGYEPQAIAFLVGSGVKESSIKLSRKNIPVIHYQYRGTVKAHFPDMFVPEKNLIVEVKSTYTAGLLSTSDRERMFFDTLKAKRKRARELGYSYRVLVMVGDAPLTLPKDWELFSHTKIVRWYTER